MAALFLAVASPAMAEGKDKGPTPQQLHDEFVGYAQKYYGEAKELSYKAAKTDDAHKAVLFRQLADINHQLAGQKERMAVSSASYMPGASWGSTQGSEADRPACASLEPLRWCDVRAAGRRGWRRRSRGS